MTDVVQEAAALLLPVLSAGATAAAGDLAHRAEAGASAVVLDLVRRIRAHFKGDEIDVVEVESALRRAMAADEVSESELRAFVNATQSNARTNLSIGTVEGGVYTGDIHTQTFNA